MSHEPECMHYAYEFAPCDCYGLRVAFERGRDAVHNRSEDNTVCVESYNDGYRQGYEAMRRHSPMVNVHVHGATLTQEDQNMIFDLIAKARFLGAHGEDTSHE